MDHGDRTTGEPGSTDETPPTRPDDGSGAEGETAPAFGLALSGGGVRASLFALGVVIGLIEVGWHRRVRCVASVSGGSIVNAALGHARRLGSYASVEDFESLSSRLASSLASRGAFAFDLRSLGAALWYVLRLVGRAFVPTAAILLFALQRLYEDPGFNLAEVPWSRVPWGYVGLFAALSLLVTFVLSRGLLQETKYRSVLRAVVGPDHPFTGFQRNLYVRDWGTASNGRKASEVMHVLVATDLLSGEPMFFSSRFVYCRPYGWSAPGDLLTVEALYSSAAFPAVFPPKRLKLGKLDFRNGEMPGPLPRKASLADGGVYNNLGTDWFDVLEKRSAPARPLLWPFGELDVDPPRIETGNVIVVNASAPSGSVRKLRPFPVARIMSVLYDNTVRPRVRAIQAEGRPLIDIADSPIDLAEDLAEHLDGEARERAKSLVTILEGLADRFWEDFKHETSGTATKLSPAGARTGARLMLHGYLSSLVLMHVRFGVALPEPIRGEKYFKQIVAGVRSTADADGEGTESTRR